MSSYIQKTQHPETLHFERAEWLDDYFGQHNYGVRFPSDGKVFRADEFDWHEAPEQDNALVGTHRGGVMTVEETEKGSRWGNAPVEPEITVEDSLDGKKTITTKYPDGRQDVRIEVTRLDIENRTDEDTQAEAAIIGAMAKKQVQITVVHMPSKAVATFKSPIPDIRNRALAVVASYNKKLEEQTGVKGVEAPRSEFLVIQSEEPVTITAL